ncbi:putative ribonuclease H-like domain-containing protein [Tanacetum coccineum]
MTHPSPKRNMVPKAALIRPKVVVNTAKPKAVLNAVKGNQVNDVKASACWVWKPKTKGNPQMDLQDQGVIDSGCSRHMTESISYLTDFEEIDRGYVAFGATKDETSGILKSFITGVENLIDQRVMVIRYDNGTEFKNKEMNQFCKRKGSGPNWLFDINALTKSMNYKPVVVGNQSNGNAGTKACDDAEKARMETVPGKDYILLPLWNTDLPFSQSSKSSPNAGIKPSGDNEKKVTEEPGKEGGDPSKEGESNDQEKEDIVNNTNTVNSASTNEVNAVGAKTSIELPNDPTMLELKDIVYSDDDEDVGAEADMNNLDAFIHVSPIPTTRIHKDHPVEQIIRDLNSAPQTRRMTKNLEEHEEPKKVWTLVDLPNGKRPISTKWVYRNKKDERGIMIKNKARLVAQGYTQEEGIDYDEVFAPVAKIEAIRLFLAYASFEDFMVYQMDVKSAFLYGQIEEKVYVCQPPGFEDPNFPDRRGKIHKTLFIRRDKGLQVKQKNDRIVISQDKYVTEILKKFGFTDVKTASTPMETQKLLLKDEYGKEVDVHLYRSMIGSLIYLTSSRPDIMFAVSYTNSDYAEASLDKKSTIRGCQFLRCRLISWQCKKQTVVANFTTEAEYVAASSCCGQVLWIQNQLLDYGYNFMHTKINTDNESTICIVKNPVFHSKTKNIDIRHHFIRDSNEKKLIQMIKIHTNKNVADLNTKAFDVKTINGEVQLQALVDGKKIIITEASVRRDLQLDDEEVDFLNASSLKYALTVNPTIYTWCVEKFWSTTKAKTVNGEGQLQALVDGKKIIITEATVRTDLQLEDANGVDCLPNATIFEQLTLMGYENFSQKLTFYKAFFSPQWKFLITILQCLSAKTTAWNEFSSTMASAIICLATNQKFNFSKYIFESMVKNLDNAVKFLMYPRFVQVFLNNQLEWMTTHNRVYIAPSHTKKIFANMRRQGKIFWKGNTLISNDGGSSSRRNREIKSLKKRFKKLVKKGGSRTHKLKRLYKISRSARVVSSDEPSLEITLVDETQGRHNDDLMCDTCVLNDEEVFARKDMAEKEVSTADPVTTAGEVVTTANVEVSTASPTAATITNVKLTLAQTLAELKSARPKIKRVVMQEPIEEPLKMKKKDQISFDEQEAIRLQAEFDEEVGLAREKDKAKVALIKEWNDIQANNEADQLLAERLQVREQEEFAIEERAKLFQQLLEKRIKFFAAKRAEEKRNKPPTKAQH